MLREAGYRTGLYTSPALERFNERIQINNKPVSDALIAENTTRIAKVFYNNTSLALKAREKAHLIAFRQIIQEAAVNQRLHRTARNAGALFKIGARDKFTILFGFLRTQSNAGNQWVKMNH